MNDPRVHDESLLVRDYRNGDEAQLVRLFAAVFGRTIDEGHWRWKLDHATASLPNVLLATSGDRAVFQYGGVPLPFSTAGRRANAMVAVDAMTAPDFRRRGLLTRVVTEAHARWREAGIEFVLGLPNQQWGTRTAALGWLPAFDLQRMIRPLRPQALLAQRLGLPWLRKFGMLSTIANSLVPRVQRDPAVQTRPVTEAGEEFDALWVSCAADQGFSVVRDRAWVQWRFLDCPSRRYRVVLATRGGRTVGYCAYFLDDSNGLRRAMIAELVTPRDDLRARRTLLAAILDEFSEQKVDYALSLALRSSPLHRELRSAGFFAGAAFRVHLVPLAAGLPLDSMRRAENWELSGATFDVI